MVMYTGADQENSERGGRDTCPLASYIDTFCFSENRPYSRYPHLCKRFRIDGIKAMSRGISGGKQVIKFANTSNHNGVCLSYQKETPIS